jgi:MFS family permease
MAARSTIAQASTLTTSPAEDGSTAARDPQGGASQAGRVYLYFGLLTLLLSLTSPGAPLLGIPTAFMLKNQLHASASQVARFGFLTALPLYLSPIFGLTRDRWSPLGLRDRGYLLLFAPAMVLAFLGLASSKLSFVGLFTGILIATVASQFMMTAYTALTALVAQEQLMSGRLASLLGIVGSIPLVGGALVSGWLVEHISPSNTFLAATALALGVGLIGVWKPSAVFEHAYSHPLAQGADFWGDVQRLFRHKAIYPVLLINCLSQFMPGIYTPMQYYLTDKLGAPDGVYGYYMAIFSLSFVPTYFLYAWLCKRVSLKKLLLWGTIIEIPQMVPLMLIHSGHQAMVLAIPLGLMGGIAAAAYNDLTMRSCPPGLQGTFMTLMVALVAVAVGGGNLIGTALYSSSPSLGFFYDVIATVVVYAAILPLLKLIPREVIATADGERNPAFEV